MPKIAYDVNLSFSTGHPRFFNQLSTGLDIVSLAGEYLTATCNTNMFTYEIAPVFILMEHATFSKMREIIGFTNGDSIMAPGIVFLKNGPTPASFSFIFVFFKHKLQFLQQINV